VGVELNVDSAHFLHKSQNSLFCQKGSAKVTRYFEVLYIISFIF
jgi:hypothetical protein